MNGNVSCFDTERMTHTGNSQIVTKLWNMNGRATLPQDGFLRKGGDIDVICKYGVKLLLSA